MAEDEKNSVTPERVNERLTIIGTISLFFSVLFSLINFLTLRSTNLNFWINLLQNYVPLVIISYLMYIVYETSKSGIEFFQKINKKNLFKVTLLECLSILNVLATLPTSKKLPIKIIIIFFIFYVIGFFIALKGRNSEKNVV
ncbi:hypothetical protein AAIB42_07030 [Streptococcus ruminicola]|uniref:hypothetical protein n=1 Tax=Streptococcus ruminicola TaxID=2686210 RepID=UPI003F634AAC